jgi:hypothetical protein
VNKDARLGHRLGFDFDTTTMVPTHTCGTLSDGSGKTMKVNNGAGYAIGISTIAVDNTTLTGTLVVGDIFSFSGHSQTYTVTTLATASGNAIAAVAFTPALVAAVVDNEVATVRASHAVNLAFHREAIALAVRPMAGSADYMPEGTKTFSYMDPVSKLPFRIDVMKGYHKLIFEVKVLYGFKLIDPALAVRVAG